MGVDVEVSGGAGEEEGEPMPMDDEPMPMDDEPMDDEPMDDEPELAMESLVNRVAARVAKRILNENK